MNHMECDTPPHTHTLPVGSPGDRVVGCPCLGLCTLLWTSCDRLCFCPHVGLSLLTMQLLGEVPSFPHISPYSHAVTAHSCCCLTPGGCSLSLPFGRADQEVGGGWDDSPAGMGRPDATVSRLGPAGRAESLSPVILGPMCTGPAQ